MLWAAFLRNPDKIAAKVAEGFARMSDRRSSTASGGVNDSGTVFEITPPAGFTGGTQQ
jgi:hypothetical protein